MTHSSYSFALEGIVQLESLEAIRRSHRICIAATDGHTYEVEPSYVGRYLERFVGCRVTARVQPLTNGTRHALVRILSLNVLDRDPSEAPSETPRPLFPHRADNGEQALGMLERRDTEL
jgi:hypothetical protein